MHLSDISAEERSKADKGGKLSYISTREQSSPVQCCRPLIHSTCHGLQRGLFKLLKALIPEAGLKHHVE